MPGAERLKGVVAALEKMEFTSIKEIVGLDTCASLPCTVLAACLAHFAVTGTLHFRLSQLQRSCQKKTHFSWTSLLEL